jgi:hyperosmotically inducible periplasmic protein
MSHRFAVLTCLLTSVACSHQNEGVRDPDDLSQSNATSEPQLTPASSKMTPASSKGSARETRDITPAAPAPATPPATETRAPAEATTPRGDAAKASDDQPAAPDNTKVNERDRDAAALTPLDQRENESDLEITQRIRQAVMADDSLSFTAKNVKIITAGGKVTLRGPVKTDAERSAIEAAARKVAGQSRVDNQIEVKK